MALFPHFRRQSTGASAERLEEIENAIGDLASTIEELAAALAQTQGSSQALYFILLDLTALIARGQPDPRGFLTAMFEQISAKLDQTSPETDAKTASGARRSTLANFFSVAEQTALQGRRGEGDSGKTPPG